MQISSRFQRSRRTPSVHFPRSVWMPRRILLYSLGFRNPGTLLTTLPPRASTLYSAHTHTLCTRHTCAHTPTLTYTLYSAHMRTHTYTLYSAHMRIHTHTLCTRHTCAHTPTLCTRQTRTCIHSYTNTHTLYYAHIYRLSPSPSTPPRHQRSPSGTARHSVSGDPEHNVSFYVH